MHINIHFQYIQGDFLLLPLENYITFDSICNIGCCKFSQKECNLNSSYFGGGGGGGGGSLKITLYPGQDFYVRGLEQCTRENNSVLRRIMSWVLYDPSHNLSNLTLTTQDQHAGSIHHSEPQTLPHTLLTTSYTFSLTKLFEFIHC